MTIRAAKPGENSFMIFETVLGEPEECAYCGAEITIGYANDCIVVCEKCANRRRLPVVMSTDYDKTTG